MYKTTKLLFTTILMFTLTYISSQEIPPLQNYTPEIYNAENQNWAISQSENNLIYAANNRGLLEYNGETWRLYTSPNNSILRSVKVIDNKIYTGCYMEFGYWKKDHTGSLTYYSISKNSNVELLEDEEFWNIIQLEEWILFQSLNRIYIYNTIEKNYKTINSSTILQKMFKINNSIYFQKTNDGLYKIEKGNSILINDDPIIKNNILVGAFEMNKSLLLLTQEKGFYQLTGSNLEKYKTNSDELLSSLSVYSCLKTKDNNYILGTISNGLYQLDKSGNTLLNINQEKGLNNNTVLNVFEDSDKNIWAGLDNGISCLNYDSAFRVYNDKNGKLGTTYASITHDGFLYLGTNQGLFYKRSESNEEFKLIDKTEGQVWSLQIIDNVLFCGHNLGTYIIAKNKADLIATIPGTWKLEKLSKNNTIIQGNYNGFSILTKKDKEWKYSHQIDGFDISSRYFELTKNNKILVTHEYKGVYELELNSDCNKFINVTINKDLKGEKSSLIKYQNDILYYYDKGLLNYNTDNKKFETKEFLTKALPLKNSYHSGKLVNTDNNKLWVFTNNNIVYFSPGKLNTTPEVTQIYLPIELRKDYTGFENISSLTNENYLLGTSFGYLIIDTKKLNQKKHSIQLNQITKRKLNDKAEIVSLTKNTDYNFKENNLDFSLSVPTYEKFNEIQYKYILKGRYNHWSEWTNESDISFENVPFGKYTFIAKARIGNNESFNEVSYDFKIERPWYLNNLMLSMYVIIIILFIFIIHKINKRYYKKQKQILLDKKQHEFEHTQLENEKEIMKLRNDKLRGDIEGKNRELAASTMSIIKKNEFLNSIKKELSEFENNELIKPVIKIIDKNLNNTSDWKLFQEAFNNADKDFLIKVKDKYPILTPNDLRLCAYLRLNLSSKEIAPLLNISHKSVEIKRYRLRKKMGLEKKENLIHHILEI